MTEFSPSSENSAQSRLLGLLRDEGPISRAELADRLQVPRARLAAEVARLCELRLVRDGGPAASRGGRRSTLVELDPDLRFAAVDLGATSVTIEVTDGGLTPLCLVEEPIDVRRGPVAVLARVSELLGKLAADGHYRRLAGLGIGVPGPVSFRDGVPVSPPIMPGWDGYPVRARLAGRHGCPVVIDNDVNIMVIGERYGGVARSVDDLLFVKIGTGIGCGIVIHGEVYRGSDGCAGDIGHIQVDDQGPVCACGNTGCFEALFGGAALARDALSAARTGTSPALAERFAAGGTVTSVDVGEGAHEGDATCIGLVRDGGRRLGSVLASQVSFLNPSMIVIGGGLAGLGHLLLAEIRQTVYSRAMPLATGNLPIVLSEIGETAGVLGGVVAASDQIFSTL